MQPAPANQQHFKQRMRDTWTAGDFGQIARYLAKNAEEFVERLNIRPWMQVLDVACGTGNLAIPAARKGAQVWGVDLAPHLLQQARARAAAENLAATFEEGDAEDLPHPEERFDLVMSMFGAIFGPRPERVAAELARVCRAGGRIAMANWIQTGFIARQFEISNRYNPPPEGIPAPVLWGNEEVARERLGPYASEIQATRRSMAFEFPFGPREVVRFFGQHLGPMRATLARLSAQEQAAYTSDLEQLWSDLNEAGEGQTRVQAEYLEVVATRA